MSKKTSLIFKLISYFYILQPLGYIFLLAFQNQKNPVEVFMILNFSGFHWIAWWFFLVTAPIVGFGLLFVKKWGWFSLIGHSILLATYNGYNLLAGSTISESVLMVVFLVGIVSFMIFFQTREIKSPFFNPVARWWFLDTFIVDTDALVIVKEEMIDGRIYDINKHGCFLKMEPSYEIGETVSVKLDIGHELRGDVLGEIVWSVKKSDKYPDGLGIRFLKKNEGEKEFIKRVITTLKEKKK